MMLRGGRAIRRRGRRGGAMLELILILPIYILLLFMVWTFGDIGLVSSQAHQSSRFLAWKRNPVDRSVVMDAFGKRLRGTAGSGSETVYFYGYGGHKRGAVAQAWGNGVEVPAAHSFNLYGNQDAGIEGSYANRETSLRRLEASEVDHSGQFVGPPAGNVYAKYPTTTDHNHHFTLLDAALAGDVYYKMDSSSSGPVSTGAGKTATGAERIPWLRRRYGTTTIHLRGAAGITSWKAFTSRHTVLLGNGYQSAPEKYYGSGAGPEYQLRGGRAWRTSNGLASQQLHHSSAAAGLRPDF